MKSTRSRLLLGLRGYSTVLSRCLLSGVREYWRAAIRLKQRPKLPCEIVIGENSFSPKG
jgi:hypothetical protein